MPGMRNRCHFHCRAGLLYGWGHLVRATTLANHLRRQGWRCSLAVEGEPGCRGFLVQRGFPDAVILAPGDEAEARRLGSDPADLVVVDMLEPTDELLSGYRRSGAKLLVFSDTGIAHRAADLVICPNPEEVWAANRSDRMIGGLGYVIVPEQVTEVGRLRQPAPPMARRLFVNMGGSMSLPVFAAVADILGRLGNRGFGGCFLLGYHRDFEIDEESRRKMAAFTMMDGTNDIAPLLARAEIALTAAGYMRYEIAAAGLPAVLVSLVDHQHQFGRMFAAAGVASYVGGILHADHAFVVDEIMSLADDPFRRAGYSAVGTRLVDGRALERISQAASNLIGG